MRNMKYIKFITCILTLVYSYSTYAQNIDSIGTLSSSGSNAVINTSSNSHGSDMSRMVPNTIIPGLSNVPETCAVSNAAGGSMAGFGIVVGITMTEEQCNMRMNARLIAQMGDAKTAKALLCQDEKIRAAYRIAGNLCEVDLRAKSVQPQTAPQDRPNILPAPHTNTVPQGSG